MSLEAAIAENTAAVKALTEAVLAGNEGRAAVLEAAQNAATKTKPAAAAKKAEAPAAEPAAEPETPKAAEQPAAAAQPNACQQAVIDYLGETEGAEREARSAKVKEILKKVGVAKAVEVPEDKVAPFLRTFEKLKAAGNLVADAEPEDFA